VYIVSYEYELDKIKEYEILIEPPADKKAGLEGAVAIRYHRYHIEYKRKHEVICPRYIFSDGTYVTVVPYFLIPGRRYPIQVFLYASGLYSTDPKIGQRGAAKATCAKFGLKSFSHSTVCRSFKAFEETQRQALERRFGEEAKDPADGANPAAAAAGSGGEKGGGPGSAKRFPTAMDTGARRKGMAEFLRKYLIASECGDFETAARDYVRYWHEKTQGLLLGPPFVAPPRHVKLIS